MPTTLRAPMRGWYVWRVPAVAALEPWSLVAAAAAGALLSELGRLAARARRGRRRLPASDGERLVATVLFTDIVGSTRRAVEIGDRRWRSTLVRHHAVTREEVARHRGVEIDTAGDGFFVCFDSPERAVRCATAIAGRLRRIGIRVRAGVHAGECEVVDGKPCGVTVNVGAHIATQAQPGEVLVSNVVRDLLAGSKLRFVPRGRRRVGPSAPGSRLYAPAAAPQRALDGAR